MKAYSAAVYIRIIDEELDKARVTLLMAKTKVAPITPVSIPRLELCRAVLLIKTIKFVAEIMSLQHVPLYCHTDSTVVLAWLGKHPSTWKTFVANRVALINELLPRAKWRHVQTKDNPADCASRGILPIEILHHPLWWQGPPWLASHSSGWPDLSPIAPLQSDLELRSKIAHQAKTEIKPFFELLTKFSSWPKLRVAAYCKRFIIAFVIKYAKCSIKAEFDTPCLNALEIQRASVALLKLVRAAYFADEIRALRQEAGVSSKSTLKRLNPFLDSEGVLRVGGRLFNPPISYDEKHPIIVPRHYVGELLASNPHIRSLHGGLQLTLHMLRQRYWLISAHCVVKSVIKKCVVCARQRAEVPQQLMSNLLDFRVTPSHCFHHTGVDYAGPYDMRATAGRGHKSHKTYVALFVCYQSDSLRTRFRLFFSGLYCCVSSFRRA